MSKQLIDLIVRLIVGGLNAINRKNKKDATVNPADTIANGGIVHKSKLSFSDLASKAGRDKTE